MSESVRESRRTVGCVAALACIAVAADILTASSGCVNLSGMSCTAVGCVDQATLDLESTTGAWAPGMYELTAVIDGSIDGNVGTCELQIPSSPSPTGVVQATCTSGLGLMLDAVVSCQTMQSGGAIGQSCRPVPGHFHQTLTIAGTPSRVTLTLSRDGEPLFDAPVTFAFHEFLPNGPQCGPGCKQASEQLMVLADAGVDSGAMLDSGGDASGP